MEELTCEDAIAFVSESKTQAAAIVNEDFTFRYVNQCWCNMLNAVPEHFRNKTFEVFTHPEDIENDVLWANKLISGQAYSYELGKRYKVLGTAPPTYVSGVLYVTAAWEQNKFSHFRVIFTPHQITQGITLQTWKDALSWSIKNYKTLLWVLLVIASLTGIGSNQLLEIISKVRKAKSTVDSLQELESPPSESLSPVSP